MKKSQTMTLVLLFILQFAAVFMLDRLFVHDMREDRNILEQRLIADGVPMAHVNAIDNVLSKTMLNVSSYVRTVSFMLVIANLSVASVLAKKNKEHASP